MMAAVNDGIATILQEDLVLMHLLHVHCIFMA